MDFYDRDIMAIMRDGKTRTFQQILSEAGFSHNTLRRHLDELVDRGLIARRKRPARQGVAKIVKNGFYSSFAI